MTINIKTLVFNGLTPTMVEVQVQIKPGLPKVVIVGLADKSVNESRERIDSVLESINLSMPPKHITINLSPANLEKSGSHFDLPILCGLLAVMGILPAELLEKYIILGEVSLDGHILKTAGVLPASVFANENNLGIICPMVQGGEAMWAGHNNVLAPSHILELINHFKGTQILPLPKVLKISDETSHNFDMSEIKGQEAAKRALEIAAAGGHALLMVGPPGSGKTMLASRLPTILPPMTAKEMLDSSIIYSIAGLLSSAKFISNRPFRAVHHTASPIALAGGGANANPGEISLAHNGVLFLDELPEFQRATLEILRQPMEKGTITISRAKKNASYPARFQLIAAMNPCPCGYLGNPAMSCSKAPRCAEAYQNKISGPLLDRIDLHVDVDAVNPWELSKNSENNETSAVIRERVLAARKKQLERSENLFGVATINAHLDGRNLELSVDLKSDVAEFLNKAAEKMGLSARGYHRILRIARTIADLRDSDSVDIADITEALTYRPIHRGKYGA